MRKTLTSGVAVFLGASALLLSGAAQAGATENTVEVCGFYTAGGHAYYKHCGSIPVGVWVDTWDNQDELWYCAPVGDDRHLGPTSKISWASHQQAC
ncbi:DUF6355 family natural product biosynthesis protein [Amycolatopsis pittospori]|uniref:DUF6355 family natural product biosynthesis protein n=1 Tax=Amycolatopsis pittospori TaxID=2749434 RepID=UPI0015F05214|nr:DUF6355 family natural product biosynthesis protein [Amycolatopsis pittospori]